MPTKKPIIQTVLNEMLYSKFNEIAENEKRSKSQLAAIAIEEYITNYKKKNENVTNLSNSKIEKTITTFDSNLLKAYSEAESGIKEAVNKLLNIKEEIEEMSSDQKIG